MKCIGISHFESCIKVISRSLMKQASIDLERADMNLLHRP